MRACVPAYNWVGSLRLWFLDLDLYARQAGSNFVDHHAHAHQQLQHHYTPHPGNNVRFVMFDASVLAIFK